MMFMANGKRQKLNFLLSAFSCLYTKVKIFAFAVNKRFFPIFLLVDLRIIDYRKCEQNQNYFSS